MEEEAVIRPELYAGPGQSGGGVEPVFPGRQQLARPHGPEEGEEGSCPDVLDGLGQPTRGTEFVT